MSVHFVPAAVAVPDISRVDVMTFFLQALCRISMAKPFDINEFVNSLRDGIQPRRLPQPH